METMHKHRGLTLFEILVVIGILAIVSAFVVPNVMSWRSAMKLRGAINNLKGDLELAKARAIRENNLVVIKFNKNGYTIFVDNGAGGAVAGDWMKQVSELLLRNRNLPRGVIIDLDSTTFANNRTRFNSRGHCAVLGSAVLKNEKGESKTIAVSRLGINIKKKF